MDILTTIESEYESKMPADVERKDLDVKQIFMTERGSIVVWVQHAATLMNSLVHLYPKGESTWYELQWRTVIKQLNQRQILILNKDDGSIDQLSLNPKKEWTLQNVRPPKILHFEQYSFDLFVFSQSQTYCLSEQYRESVQNILFCEIENGIQKINNLITVPYKKTRFIQLNQMTKVGWLEKVGNNWILDILDLQINNSFIRKIQLPTEVSNSSQNVKILSNLEILDIRQILDDRYVIFGSATKHSYSSRFWIIDLNRLKQADFVRKVQFDKQNIKLFDYDCYSYKIFGMFIITRENQHPFLDSSVKSVKLNLQGTHFLGLKKTQLDHNEKMGNQIKKLEKVEKVADKFAFKITWKMFLKQHFMHMLLHIDEDFDDDLLEDVLELL